MTPVTLPQARAPLGYALIDGNRYPVEIDMEWARAFSGLISRSGGVLGDELASDSLAAHFDSQPLDSSGHDALRVAEEVRNELASLRTDNARLRTRVEELEGRLG